MDERLRKRFSIGLCLSEDSQKSVDFFCKYQNWLDSVYFSLPLGKNFIQELNYLENMMLSEQMKNYAI